MSRCDMSRVLAELSSFRWLPPATAQEAQFFRSTHLPAQETFFRYYTNHARTEGQYNSIGDSVMPENELQLADEEPSANRPPFADNTYR